MGTWGLIDSDTPEDAYSKVSPSYRRSSRVALGLTSYCVCTAELGRRLSDGTRLFGRVQRRGEIVLPRR